MVLYFSGNFFLTAILRIRRISMHISLFIVASPVNYTREFLKLLCIDNTKVDGANFQPRIKSDYDQE